MAQSEINEKVVELKELEAMIKELEEELEALKDVIKADMTSKGIEEMIAGNYTVRYKDVVSQRIDSKTLKKELPDVYGKYSKQVTAKRFTVA